MSEQVFVHRALFGGKGEVTVRDQLGAEPCGAFTAILDCTLEAGGSVGRHQQQRDDELVVCLSGEGEVEVDGVWRTFSPGVVAKLPMGSSLSFKAGDAAPMRYLIIKAYPMQMRQA